MAAAYFDSGDIANNKMLSTPDLMDFISFSLFSELDLILEFSFLTSAISFFISAFSFFNLLTSKLEISCFVAVLP
jgi:uncharacterized protein involved in cysteine biosynthesis